MVFFYIVFVFLILQRLVELRVAKKNSIYIQSVGGFEVGKQHYPLIVGLHMLFFLSLLIEATEAHMPAWWPIPFTIFILAQGLRIWVLSSLGRFWNTRIYVIPSSKPITKGPYRYVRHPNYLTVMIEMISIPLIFGAYYTAMLFPILNALILALRIHIEENALREFMNYGEEMNTTPKFFALRIKR